MRITRQFLFLISMLGLLAGTYRSPTASGLDVPSTPEITALAEGLSISWQLPEVNMVANNDDTYTLTMPGLERMRDPGVPALPMYTMMIALPPDAEPAVQIETRTETRLPAPGRLALAPQPIGVVRSVSGQVIGGGFQAAEIAFPFDKPLIVLEHAGTMRGVRLARVTIYPVRPSGDHLLVTTSLAARISFNAPTLTGPAGPGASDPIHQAIGGLVVNPEQIQVMDAAAKAMNTAVANETAVIEVDQVGMTAVTYDDLAAIGFAVDSVNPHQLQLTHYGEEIAAEWEGDGDDAFEPGEALRFYAAPWFSRWMNNDVYLLAAGDTDGLRMTTQSAAPDGLDAGIIEVEATAEENNIYTPDCLCGHLPAGRDGDRWAWDDLRQPGRPSGEYAIQLSDVDTGQAAELTLWLIGFTALDVNPDHQVDLTFNGQNLGTVTWDGKTAVTGTLTIPAPALQTNNILSLNLPGAPGAAIDGIWLDAAHVTYARGNAAVGSGNQLRFRGQNSPHAYSVTFSAVAGVRAYDVSDPAAPVRLTGINVAGGTVSFGDAGGGQHTYALATNASMKTPAGLRLKTALQTETGADYVMIAPFPFIPALDPLVALREGQGMTVIVEDLQAIYDGFGYGRTTPEAIHDYLDHIYHTWNPVPTTILLVGDGTTDPKLYKDDSKISWLPPYLAGVDPWIGEVPADNRYVTVDGNDILPDMMIGRLPVNSLGEAETVVNKIVAYEAEPVFGDWNSRVTFVADDADSAGDFEAHSNTLINDFIADPWSANPVYHLPPATSESDIQTAVQQSWHNGQGIIMFTGHSSIHQWGAERYFHLDDVATLNNGARLPVVLEMTCFTGSFQQPFWDTLDEALLRYENGGAVAVWGATGLGVATGHQELAAGFFDSLITQSNPMLGQAIVAGKLNVFTQAPAHNDLIDTFTLLGDPAMQYDYDFWPGHQVYAPILTRD